MIISHTTQEVRIEQFNNKTVQTTIKITEKVDINENEIFEIREYNGLFVVAPKGTPMPSEAWVGGPEDNELRFGDGDPDAFDYYWSQECDGLEEAVEQAYYWWRKSQ